MANVGEIRTVNGRTEIFVKKWVSYPQQASDLISLAYEHGWGVDDGLPNLKIREDGYPFIRVLIARPAGRMARSLDVASPAYQFHLTWDATNDGWKLGTIYVKQDQQPWKSTGIRDVQGKVAKFALRLPRVYAPANH